MKRLAWLGAVATSLLSIARVGAEESRAADVIPPKNALQTRVTAVFPIMKGLMALEGHVGSKAWQCDTEEQANFLKNSHRFRGQLEKIPEIDVAVGSSEDLNGFIKKHKGTLQAGPMSSGAAYFMDWHTAWTRLGHPTKIEYDGVTYAAAELSDVKFSMVDGHPNPIAEIATQIGDRVYITKMSEEEWQKSLLPYIMTQFSPRKRQRIEEIEGKKLENLIFPEYTHSVTVNHDWMTGMKLVPSMGNPFVVNTSLQRFQVFMDRMGAGVKTEGILAYTSGLKQTVDVRIDGPFACWIERDGLEMPLFAGFIAPESWRLYRKEEEK